MFLVYQHLSPGACFQHGHVRLTFLTQCLVRMEYDPSRHFEERPTLRVLCRKLDDVAVSARRTDNGLELSTPNLRIVWDYRDDALSGVKMILRGNFSTYHGTWHEGDPFPTLGGTARTLDKTNGEIQLEPGLMSKYGFSVLDDSASPVYQDDAWVSRDAGVRDLYFWGYGHDYRRCLADYFRLTGATPMLPRFALGNWWSRYYPYTQADYLALMDRFEREKLPFSVAVLDMDWHLTHPPEGFGSGWTGYTWNPEFFPDPEAFLRGMHDRKYRVTLNLHPAEGVRPYESAYPAMAQAMGIDSTSEQSIDFDLSDPSFVKAYMEKLHRPLERQGVDFWWVDWQQGNRYGAGSLDPLWALNKLHYTDSAKHHDRGLIFSRYAGFGSHRFPIGFSGDTYISWESLEFQPYFTITASNIGYCWWSHDIGGHMHGVKDEELMTRWVQFGVFSPIMRLHSGNNEFSGKEPWKYGVEASSIQSDFLRLRHRLIPYLFNMNYDLHHTGRAPIEPMYYGWPEEKAAYTVKNQYMFGPDLLVCPITSPRNSETACGAVTAWLPEGLWYDFFSGRMYTGGRCMELHRELAEMPVFARAGAILPLSHEDRFTNDTNNPQIVELQIFAGADGLCLLHEDGGTDASAALTRISFSWPEGRITINAPEGDCSCIPEKRGFLLQIFGLESCGAYVDGQSVPARYDPDRHVLEVDVPSASRSAAHKIQLDAPVPAQDDPLRYVYRALDRAGIPYDQKAEAYRIVSRGGGLEELIALSFSQEMLSVLAEALYARR